jgi:hypothetical protein
MNDFGMLVLKINFKIYIKNIILIYFKTKNILINNCSNNTIKKKNMPSIPRPGVHFFFPQELLINKCIVNNQSMNTVDSITGDVTYNI